MKIIENQNLCQFCARETSLINPLAPILKMMNSCAESSWARTISNSIEPLSDMTGLILKIEVSQK